MKKSIVILFCLFLIVTTSCEEDNNQKYIVEPNELVVIDCLITSEFIPQKITISRTATQNNVTPSPINNAIVEITDGTNIYKFTKDSLVAGVYYSLPFQAVVDKKYTLTVWVDDKIFQATTYNIPVIPSGSFDIKMSNVDTLYEIPETNYSDDDAMWHYHINWENLNSNYFLKDSLQYAKIVKYTLHIADVNQVFAPSKELIYFPRGSKIIRRKYSINPEYVSFLKTMLAETQWRGGYFDINPANVITNFTDGALGFFTASTVYVDSIVIP